MRKETVEYSVIVPIYNEEGNIMELDKEIKSAMSKLGKYEIIYVNDGSDDKSLEILSSLKKIKIINLNRNYGQSIALDAGFKECAGEIVITLDGDLQNDPDDIPRLVKKLKENNLDVVAGWRRERKDKAGFRILTRMGMNLRRILMNDHIHDSGCTLRAYRKRAVKSLDLWGEMHRYILALLKWKGYRIGEIEVDHRERMHGETKYGYRKALKGFIDLLYISFINKYSNRPLHVFGALGIVSFIIGFFIELWMLIGKIFLNYDLSANAWFILGFFFIIVGVQFFVAGVILDLLLRSYFNTSRHEDRYYIREILGR